MQARNYSLRLNPGGGFICDAKGSSESVQREACQQTAMDAANGAPPPFNGQQDDRVYWDKQEQKWCLEDEHGASFQYSEAVKTWIPLVCSDAALES